jgi:hypothetical protein
MMPAHGALVRLRFSVTWTQVRQLLRLVVDAPGTITSRVDMVSGGPLARDPDGREYPLHGGLLVGSGSSMLGIASPDVFSAAVEDRAVSLALLRSPYTAHHDPTPADVQPDQPVCDQGVHTFDIALRTENGMTIDDVAGTANGMAMPPVVWDLTG